MNYAWLLVELLRLYTVLCLDEWPIRVKKNAVSKIARFDEVDVLARFCKSSSELLVSV